MCETCSLPSPYLLPLHHLLVQEVREGAQRVELSGALGAGEHAVLVHQAASADGDDGDTMATQAFVQVGVSALHLGLHGDGPEERGRVTVGQCGTVRCCVVLGGVILGCVSYVLALKKKFK